MMRLIETTPKALFSKTGFIFLVLSFGAGCGSSDGSGTTDGGGPSDGATSGTSGTSGTTVADGAGSTSGASAVDAMVSLDGSHPVAPGNDSGANTKGGQAVDLASAGTYAILAKTGVSSAAAAAVTGNIGVSPAAATYITGFGLTLDSTNVFATSQEVVGKVYASDYAAPTPSNLTTAIGDMQLAFTDAAGRAAGVTELGAGNIGGMTLAPGVYAWSTGVTIPVGVTLTGTATDVWIFQIAQDLTVSAATNVALTGGAVAKNVVWEVAGAVDIGTTAQVAGIVLAQTSIAVETGASVSGRLLAQTAVTLGTGSVVVQPAL